MPFNVWDTFNAWNKIQIDAGEDFSAFGGVKVFLEAKVNSAESFSFIWEQISGDPIFISLGNKQRAYFISPSKTYSQYLTFKVTAFDTYGNSSSDTITVRIARVENSEILKKMEILDFELESQGTISAYKNRSNREPMRFKPSDPVGIITDEDGFLDLENNDISKIEIISDDNSISTESDSIYVSGSYLYARLGDLALSSGTLMFTVIFYIGNDQRGLVVSSKGTAGYKSLVSILT
ncbi:MAG: hypothetical protein U9Q87_09080 [Pseudomonadota bacterium]|nr:hypothetical protein [Pseudomonadota bacterium]